jgi:hypothetical protein
MTKTKTAPVVLPEREKTGLNPILMINGFPVDWDTKRVTAYILGPGQMFPGFGGSSSGLLVGKTASLIIRRVGAWGSQDSEYDVNDAGAWEYLRRCMAHGKIG